MSDDIKDQEEPTNTVSFKTRKPITQSDNTEPDEDLLTLGLEAFHADINDDAKGFLAIVFDKDGHPRITWAGDIDMIPSIGALEVAKNEFLKNVYPDPNN